MHRRLRLMIACTAALPLPALAQETALQFKGQQIAGPSCAIPPVWEVRSAPRPCTDAELAAWREDATHWRAERRIRAGLDGTDYRRSDLNWAQSSVVQPQMMVQDRFFYDPTTRRYTVGRYLDDLEQRYGGIDSVLVWPSYPNLGVDDRNQHDLLGDLPGGLQGVRSFVADFHARGVKVLFPYLPWDQGTRDEGKSDVETLTRHLLEVGADGVNGDTMDGLPQAFRTASDALAHPLVLEPEIGPVSDEMLNWNMMSWGYWDYEFVPKLSRYKWLEPRYTIHVSNRFIHDHTNDLQFAFFNGTGSESWENVWGVWNGLTPRDAEALRRIASIERFGHASLVSQGWQPFAAMRQYGVFASAWPRGDTTLWTIINRNHYAVGGRALTVPHQPGMRYFDLWRGRELHGAVADGQDTLSLDLDADGFGAVFATPTVNADLSDLLRKMRAREDRPLSGLPQIWRTLAQHMVPVATTRAPTGTPPGMSRIPAADFLFRVNGVMIEGANDEGVDVQYPGEPSARRFHERTIRIPAFWIDTTPVTIAAFKRFLNATSYRPADDHNFLRDWRDGVFPKGWDDKSVTWVSIEDARGQAIAARMGMAICGSGHRWACLSLGRRAGACKHAGAR